VAITYRIPIFSEAVGVASESIEYEALEFPISLEALVVDRRGRSDAEGVAYLEWVKATEPVRTPYAVKVLRGAGAPLPNQVDHPDDLNGTGQWIRRWWPIVLENWKGVCWGNSGFGTPVYLVSPGKMQTCDEMRHLELSVSHDLGFVLASWARKLRPDLEWSLVTDTEIGRVQRHLRNVRLNLPTLDPTTPPIFRSTPGVLREALFEGQMLDERDKQDIDAGMRLARIYQRLVEPPVALRAKGSQGTRFGGQSRVNSRRPAPQYRARPESQVEPPPTELVEAIAAFRNAGWFARYRRWNDDALATLLSAKWQSEMGGDLHLWPGELDWRLIIMDEERTWFSDVEADVAEGGNVYADIVRELARKSNGLFEAKRVGEDWRGEPGSVLINFRSHKREIRFSVPVIGDLIHPDVIHCVNELIEPSVARFFFVDLNSQMAIVSRASTTERAALQQARPIELTEHCSWWEEMAASLERE
jgi:hypothetical protein